MNSQRPMPIFDGHNDALLRLLSARARTRRAPFSMAKARASSTCRWPSKADSPAACSRSSCPRPKNQVTTADDTPPVSGTAPGAPVPPPLDLATAQAAVSSMASILIRIEREANGRLRICRTVEDIRHCIDAGVLAAVLHIEGAEAIDPEFETLDVLHQAGLRSLGPVWSRPNAFGHGVPFRCPSSPDTGPGLTDLGKELIRACNRLKILIDLSHLNERGFWDVAELSDAPLVATHSNAHALSPHSRNLTDQQLAAIRETGGMVGVNFAVSFLRADGRQDRDTPVELIVDHVEHMLETGRRGRRRLRIGFRRRDDPEGARQRRGPAGAGRGRCARAATARR